MPPASVPTDSPMDDAPRDAKGRRTVPLSQLRTGDRARLHAADLCCDECELLRAMGMSEDCLLRVCRSGAPCIVEVNTTRLGLSPAMTRRILVTPDHPAPKQT